MVLMNETAVPRRYRVSIQAVAQLSDRSRRGGRGKCFGRFKICDADGQLERVICRYAAGIEWLARFVILEPS